MFLLGKQFCWLQLCLAFFMQQQQIGLIHGARNSQILSNRILKLLNQNESARDWNVNIKFSLHLSEFLIKQKVRFSEPTRYEEQIFFKILQKIHLLISESELDNFNKEENLFFRNIFHKSIVPSYPRLKSGNIVQNLEYKTLLLNYSRVVDLGLPDWNLSGNCLNEIAKLSIENCILSKECLHVIISNLPTYGYHRTHQILLLYLLSHHRCYSFLESTTAFEMLASEKCSEVFREQNVIRSLGIPIKYKDLILEQNVICGLFGYPEFLNIPNLKMLMSWQNIDGCFCLPEQFNQPLNCSCSNHINSLALAFYVNALLMLS